MSTLKRRVEADLLAKYRRTCVVVPLGTGKVHCISFPPVGSLRSVVQIPRGVDAGTSTRLAALSPLSVAVELPVLWNVLVAPLSEAQSGPPSTEAIAAPPAFTRYSTLLAASGAPTYTFPGSDPELVEAVL